jgi:hypothetical protein
MAFANSNNRTGVTKNIQLILSIMLLAITLSLSSGASSWFNGLPWASPAETITMVILIPFLIIIGRYFLSTKSSIIFLVILLILKLILHIGAPLSGWKVKVAPDLKNLENGDFMRTYFTPWQKDVSAILEKGWTNNKEFPIDWFLPVSWSMSSGKSWTPKVSLEHLNISLGSMETKKKNFFTWMTVEGVVRLPEGTQLILLTQGTKLEELNAISPKGENLSIPIVHSLEEVEALEKLPPSSRDWSISGKFKYLNLMDSWAFQPLLVNQDGNIISKSGNGAFWQNDSALDIEEAEIKFYWLLGKIFDCGLLVFLLLWFFRSMQRLWVQKVLSTPIIILGLLGTVLTGLQVFLRNQLASLFSVEPQIWTINTHYLAVTICVIGAGILAYTLWRHEFLLNRENSLGLIVFLLFAPAVLSYSTIFWWSDIARITFWTLSDDWTIYQYFSRLIVVDGQWLEAGEPVFMYQPLYRYFVAFFHWLFGPSAFAQRLSDSWFTLGTAIILVHLAIRFGLSAFTAVFTSMIFLSVAVGQFIDFNLMGTGLGTYTQLFFVMAAGFFLSQRPTNYNRVLIAGIFAIIGCWLHFDQVGVLGGMTCLLLNAEKGTVSVAWKNFFQQVSTHWKLIAVYLATIGMGFVVLILRNGLVGAHFGLLSPDRIRGELLVRETFAFGVTHPDSIAYKIALPLQHDFLWVNYYLLLTGKMYPKTISSWPDTTVLATVLVPGIFIGLMTLIWRPKILAGFPLTLSITILGLLSPYLFIHILGYPPRYSLQVLPFAALSLGVIFDYFYTGRAIVFKKRV